MYIYIYIHIDESPGGEPLGGGQAGHRGLHAAPHLPAAINIHMIMILLTMMIVIVLLIIAVVVVVVVVVIVVVVVVVMMMIGSSSTASAPATRPRRCRGATSSGVSRAARRSWVTSQMINDIFVLSLLLIIMTCSICCNTIIQRITICTFDKLDTII